MEETSRRQRRLEASSEGGQDPERAVGGRNDCYFTDDRLRCNKAQNAHP